MITIVAKNTVAADKIDLFKELASELVIESRKESGNISYSLYQDIHNPEILTFIETWKDQAAIDAHNQSPHFIKILPGLRELAAAESDVHLYAEL